MTVVEDIRRLDSQGVSGREIARQLGISRDSVAKYTSIDDFSPAPPTPVKRPGAQVLDGLEVIIDGWLDDDMKRPRKQRHTSRRVFDRLVTEYDYPGSYSPVQRYIKVWRQGHRHPGDGYIELTWSPGTAQVDFGEAEALIAGERLSLHILIVTFPFSNMRFIQAYRGETAECVCHGLRTIFEHIGGVPRQLIFDNATGVGRRTGAKIIESKLFSGFKLHYRTSTRYCNPYSGNEKGNVENAVGFLRRNLMVPEPVATTLTGLNTTFLTQCQDLALKPHWRKQQPIIELFSEDIAACLDLPGVGFDPVRYESRKADKTGTITVEDNFYLAGPSFHDRLLTVAIRHDVIEILDETSRPIVTFPRSYDHQDTTVFTPSSLLPALITKPGAWANSPVRPLIPDVVRDVLDTADATDRSRILAGINQASTATSFTSAIAACEHMVAVGQDPAGPGLGMLARRIAQGMQPSTSEVDLSIYDLLPAHRHTHHHHNDQDAQVGA
ncbi:IS21 family transposase [Corynebacterium sp. A21]|uniref:IS21 family transposase n=1 Tax=Corynebacterium sp. A21 TaxID=3457318 RepID=UPI003FD68B61